MNAARLTLKLTEFVSCIAAVIIKKLSDKHAERVFRINEKLSREWRLLNSLTWSEEGNDFSIFLFVGFAFITGIFFISSCTDHLMRLSEKLMCTFGALFYILEGCLVFATLEYIPSELSNYAYILGSVCFFTAALLIIDLCAFGKSEITANKSSQTEVYNIPRIHCGAPFRMASEKGLSLAHKEGNSKKQNFVKIDNKTPSKTSTKSLEKYLITAV